MSTSSLIDQLIQVEATTQTKLKSRQSDTQKQVDALTSLNGKLAALQTAAKNLQKADGLEKFKASSTATSVVATATAGAQAQALTFTVDTLAKAEVRVGSGAYTKLTDPVTTSLSITKDGSSTPIAINVKGGTLQEVVAAVNDRSDELGVRATAVQVSPGNYKLQFAATKTGDANGFTVAGIAGMTGAPAIAGTDAKITTDAGYSILSATNTFKDALPGVTFTVSAKTTDPVTIEVAKDDAATSDVVKGLIDAANAVIKEAQAKSSYDSTTKTGGVLSGESVVRSVTQALAGAISANGGVPLSKLGIQLNRDGQFTYNAETFKKALTDNPEGIKKGLLGADGFAAKLESVSTKFGDKYDGQITKTIESRRGLIKDYTAAISDWDDRLATRREALQKQYSGLEVALGKLRDQSNWLAGQLAAL
nr:flagellar filament capping protein FliD [Motilibacter aurantiacus]